MAPSGLGFLVGGGYIKDARAFYCPSVGGTMPKDTGYYSPGYNVAWPYSLDPVAGIKAATSIAALQAAGGYDAQALGCGNWSMFTGCDGFDGNCWNGYAVQCDYNYRNTSLSAIQSTVTAGGGNAWPSFTVLLGYTKPMVPIDVGGPPFKTSKTLNGRAIVTDSFNRNNSGNRGNPASVFALNYPGFGVYGHKDGYNCLYGDWSAKWYGDPKQTLIWWPATGGMFSGGGPAVYDWYGINNNAITRWSYPVGMDPHDPTNTGNNAGGAEEPKISAGVDEWHMFDVSNGFDVDVTK
jgi:hypothetical protein